MLPSDVLEDIRKRVEGGIGPLTKGGPDDLAGALLGKAQGAADQLSGFASAIGEWVAFAREFIRAEVRDVVDREVSGMGFASAKTMEQLIARIERLERMGSTGTTHKKSGGKPSSREKAKRKAIARDLDALTARVERLERGAGSSAARVRPAKPMTSAKPATPATAAKPAAERPQNGRPARSTRSSRASRGSSPSRVGATGAKRSGGQQESDTGRSGDVKGAPRGSRSVGSVHATPAASDGAPRSANGR